MHRRRLAVAASVLILAAGACSSSETGAPAREGGPTAPATSAPRTPPTSPVSEPALAPSPLAEQTEELGSAIYDPAEHQARATVPTSLAIPSIGVADAVVEPVGVEPNGEMEIPPPAEVGWYRFGAAPGEPGSSVLAAHIAYDGVDGVFRHLDRIDPGAEVVVAMDDGTTRAYRVTEVATYPKQALPDDLFSTSTGERLVLITCGGRFNPSLRSYESNVVAYAVPVE